MKHIRPLLLAFSTLVLLAACSQPEDMQTGLEPQFGTSGSDAATAVSVASSGVITKAVVFTHGPIDSPDHPSSYRTRLLLRQLDSSSKLLRQIDVGTFECANSSYDCDPPTITDVKTDSPGNIYAITEMGTAPDDVPRSNYTLYQYSRAGTLLWKKTLGQVSTDDRIPFEFDRNNNVFVAQNAYEGLSYFARYNPNGVKW